MERPVLRGGVYSVRIEPDGQQSGVLDLRQAHHSRLEAAKRGFERLGLRH